MLSVEALSAQWDVSFVTADQLQGVIEDSSECEVSILVAYLADSSQFLYFLGLRDQIYYIFKASSQEGAI